MTIDSMNKNDPPPIPGAANHHDANKKKIKVVVVDGNSKIPAAIDDDNASDESDHVGSEMEDDSNVQDEEENGNNDNNNQGQGQVQGQSRKLKRLHMNRESARARRKRKKVLLESLEEQVTDLMKRNQVCRLLNESLTHQVQQLESDLAVANATIVMLRTSNGGGVIGGQGPNGSQQSHLYGSDGATSLPQHHHHHRSTSSSGGSSNDSAIQRFLLAQQQQSRGVNFFHNTALSAQDYGLFSNGNGNGSSNGNGHGHGHGHHQEHVAMQHRQQQQLSQATLDRVIATLLMQQQQQLPCQGSSPRQHDQRLSVNQFPVNRNDTLASAVEMGRLRAMGRMEHNTISSGSDDAVDNVNGNINSPPTVTADSSESRLKAFDAIVKYQQQQHQYQQEHRAKKHGE